MKILHIIPSLQKGGAERLVLDICNDFIKRGLGEILLVVMRGKNEYPELSTNIPIVHCNSKVIPSISGKAVVKLEEFRKIVADFKPDVIHSHLYEADITSRWETYPGITYVTHCHDNIRQYRKFDLNCLLKKSRLTDLYERRLMINNYRRCNNNFLAISRHMEVYLKSTLPKDLHRIKLLHNAIDLSSFGSGIKSGKTIAKSQPVKLINIGSFVDKKNQAFLVDVMKFLRGKGVDVTLELIGGGPNLGKVESQIKENGLSNNIFCRGKVNNVENYLRNADIYVHSALYEPFGLVLIEAMAAGLPVVCLDGKGNRDIIEEGKNGFIIATPDIEAFASKIISLINNSDLYTRISCYAQEFTLNYNISSYTDSLMDYYRCAIKNQKTRGPGMKIMQVVPCLDKGGAEKMVVEISNHLKAYHNIEVLIATIYPPNKNEYETNNVKRICVNPTIETSILGKSRIDISFYNKVVADFCPDIIHSHLYESEILSRWNPIPGIKYITHCHNNYTQLENFSFKIFYKRELLINFFERMLLIKRYKKCSNNFIAISNENISYYNRVLPKNLRKITLMSNAIDFFRYNRNVVYKEIDHSRTLNLLTVGGLIENKNHIFLIEVAEILIKRGYKIHLKIIGTGPYREKLEKAIQARGLEDIIMLVGEVNNVEDYYHESDIYLHSSLFESLCLVMLEANAAGLPVVCLDAKGNRDILKQGYNGFMLEKPDTIMFAEKIEQLIAEPGLYKTISRNAVTFAAAYDITLYIDKLVRLYRTILDLQKEEK